MFGRTPRSSVAAPRIGGTDIRPYVRGEGHQRTNLGEGHGRTAVLETSNGGAQDEYLDKPRFSDRGLGVHDLRTYISILTLRFVQAIHVQPASPGADHEPGPRAAWAASGQGKAKASERASATGSDKGSVMEAVWAPAEQPVGYASGPRGAYGFGFGPGIGFGPGGCGFGPGGVGFGRGVAHAKGNICTLLYVRTYVFVLLTYCPSQCRYTYVRTYVYVGTVRT